MNNLEVYVVQQKLQDEFEELHDDLVYFYQTDDKKLFNGWLLTLNAEEFSLISNNLEEFKNKSKRQEITSFVIKLCAIEMFKENNLKNLSGNSFNVNDIINCVDKLFTNIQLISFYKMGMIDFKMKENNQKDYSKPIVIDKENFINTLRIT